MTIPTTAVIVQGETLHELEGNIQAKMRNNTVKEWWQPSISNPFMDKDGWHQLMIKFDRVEG